MPGLPISPPPGQISVLTSGAGSHKKRTFFPAPRLVERARPLARPGHTSLSSVTIAPSLPFSRAGTANAAGALLRPEKPSMLAANIMGGHPCRNCVFCFAVWPCSFWRPRPWPKKMSWPRASIAAWNRAAASPQRCWVVCSRPTSTGTPGSIPITKRPGRPAKAPVIPRPARTSCSKASGPGSSTQRGSFS